MSEALKPCPFCGGAAEYDSHRYDGRGVTRSDSFGHAVYCPQCMTASVGGCMLYETEEDAVTAWNTRTPAAEAERLRAALKDLYAGYVRTIEIGRERIVELGGDCDPVDRMVSGDPTLIAARAALLAAVKEPPK